MQDEKMHKNYEGHGDMDHSDHGDNGKEVHMRVTEIAEINPPI